MSHPAAANGIEPCSETESGPSNDYAKFYSLPEVYDILHAAGTALEVTGLERIARQFIPQRPLNDQLWLEPACGTGRYLRVAAGRGRRVIGFDLSPAMAAYANRAIAARIRRRAAHLSRQPDVSCPVVRVADLTDFATTMSDVLPPRSVDLAFNLINTIRHLPSDAAMLRHLAQIASVLRPGGIYAVGFSLSAYGLEIPSEDVWIGRRGACEVRQVVQYLPADAESRAERVISHLTVARGRNVDEIDFAYDLRSYTLAQWTGLIAKTPLEIVTTVREDGTPFGATEPGYAIFLLTRRSSPLANG